MNEWNTGTKTEVADNCDFCTTKKATFILSDEILGVVRKLCADMPNDEWQMLLIGTDDGNVVRCTDYFIPKQEVTGASVTNLDCIDLQRITELGIVATIHSHDAMSVFFSSTDHDSTNTSLIKNHIVCNNAGDFKGTKAIVLPCGMKKFVDAVITRDMPDLPKIKKVKGIKNISKISYTTYPFEQEPIWLRGRRKQHAFNF